MTIAAFQSLSLAEFLQLPETKPASEFIALEGIELNLTVDRLFGWLKMGP